ncbi:MAG: DUF4270 domain-containing protein [Chitinophagales bacterium]
MKQFRVLVSIYLILVVSIFSCRKATLIGDELIPESDFLHSQREDTFSIITNTLLDDSVVTSFNTFHALGSLDDDTLGKTSASLYTQILLPTNNLTLGDSVQVDSIVLIFDYAGLYGDSTAAHTLKVYKMLEDIETTLYYSDAKLHSLPVEIGRKENFIPNLNDSVVIGNVTLPPHLRIRMNDWFADELVNSTDTTRFIDNTNFLDFLKGLYIETDISGGYSNSIMYLDLKAFFSGMQIYYENSIADSLSILFPFSGNKFSYYTHDFSGTVAGDKIATPDTVLGDAETFVRGFGGLKTYVRFPYLDSLKNVSINKAELVFTIESTSDTVFSVPPALLLVRTDSTLRNRYDAITYSTELYHSLPDQSFADPLNYGGKIDTITNIYGQNVYVYKYNISLYIQDIVLGKTQNDGLMLVCYPGNRIPNGVTLFGSNALDFTKRPYLSITYTLVDP